MALPKTKTRMGGSHAGRCLSVVELVGTSTKSWEDAARNAVERASESLHDLRVAEVTKLDMAIDNGTATYRAKINLSFKYEGSGWDRARCTSRPLAPVSAIDLLCRVPARTTLTCKHDRLPQVPDPEAAAIFGKDHHAV
jgi:dodecin